MMYGTIVSTCKLLTLCITLKKLFVFICENPVQTTAFSLCIFGTFLHNNLQQ